MINELNVMQNEQQIKFTHQQSKKQHQQQQQSNGTIFAYLSLELNNNKILIEAPSDVMQTDANFAIARKRSAPKQVNECARSNKKMCQQIAKPQTAMSIL